MRFNVLAGKIVEKQIKRQAIADVLNISIKTLAQKIDGKTDFYWHEVNLIRDTFFPEIPLDVLFQRGEAATGGA